MKKQITLAVIALSLGFASTAFAVAQNKQEQKCINTLNKGMAKVGGTTNKSIAKCAKTRSKDGTTNVQSCGTFNDKLTKAANKVCNSETKACTDTPGFGYTGCFTVNDSSITESRRLAEDVFGSGISTGVTECADDKPKCKCQAKTYKASLKVYKMRMKGYNKCKKLGLKNKVTPFDASADLNGCITADVKSKISKAETKLEGAITKKCAAVVSPFSGAFGFCNGLNGASLSNCLEQRVRCHTCLTQLAGDNLSFDCDAFDDGNNENNSCDFEPEVPS